MSIKKCNNCGSIFRANHGNSKYCPGKDCSQVAKLERQIKNYVIGDDAKKSIQQNHKIFTNLLDKKDADEFELLPLIKMGFDQNGFYGSFLTKETKMKSFKVQDFYFNITPDNPQKIKIWKASKQQ